MNSNELRPGSYCCIKNLSPKDKRLILNLFLEAGEKEGATLGVIKNDSYSIDEVEYIVWHPIVARVLLKVFSPPGPLLSHHHLHDAYALLKEFKPTPNPWEIDCEIQ